MPTIRDPAKRIASLLASSERSIAREFARSLVLIRDSQSLVTIASLLERGLVEQALSFSSSIADSIASASNAAFIRAGNETAGFITTSAGSRLGVSVVFDVVNQRAVNAMQVNRLRLVREFTEEQTRATREALLDGITRGLNPRQQARAFRDSIGLTQRQVQSVHRYREQLRAGSSKALTRELRDKRFDRTIRRSIMERKPLSEKQIDRMVGRYQESYLRYRAETIGRTEALRSVNQGHNESYEQAIEQGVLDQSKVTRTWTPARDDRVRDSHDAMRGQERLIGENFITGNGTLMQYPGDPEAPGEETIQCRCTLAVRTEL